MKKFFTFPNPVNEAAARTVALGVVALSLVAFVSGQAWILLILSYGFLARVAGGPRYSPLGQFAVRAGPRVFRRWAKMVPGPPKRFAQAIGSALTLAATLTWLSAGWLDARWILLPLVGAALLEGLAGFCLGCTLFGWLIRAGVVPERVCVECGDLTERYRRAGFDTQYQK